MKLLDAPTSVHEIVVHKINMGDVEDPDLWVAQSLYEWEKSDPGKWIMSVSAPTPSWHRIPCDHGWQYLIKAYLSGKDYTFYRLKYE
jgi:hypothetical protein